MKPNLNKKDELGTAHRLGNEKIGGRGMPGWSCSLIYQITKKWRGCGPEFDSASLPFFSIQFNYNSDTA